MVTLTQAQTAFGNTRRFFAPGEKSSNKRYFGTGGFFETVTLFAATQGTTKPLTFDAAEARVQRRETNRVLSSRLNTDPSSPPDKPKPVSYPGKTPLEIGQIRVNGGMRSGNCGIMAAVAIYFASLEGVLATDMWHVTATNPTTNSYAPGIWGRNMSFGHSWAKLGTDTTGGPFVVDPWAGVVCLEPAWSVWKQTTPRNCESSWINGTVRESVSASVGATTRRCGRTRTIAPF